MSNKQTAAMLDKKPDEKTAHTVFTCGIVMVIAVLIHDGDHIRQALNWGYTIPLSLWALIPKKWNKYFLKASAVPVAAMGLKMLITGLRML